MDRISTEQRSKVMSRVKGKNTLPEIMVRSLLHRMGYRFRLHGRDLPGRPDIILKKYRTVVFVHGCFWHQHKGCKKAQRPISNADFWNKKLERNLKRDRAAQKDLRNLGWKIVVVWECKIKNKKSLLRYLLKALSD